MAMITGVLLFAVVAHFFLKPKVGTPADIPPTLAYALLGFALVACALALVLRGSIPTRTNSDSADAFWLQATGPAMRMWACLEGASLLSVFLYSRTGAPATIVVAVVAIALFILLNPRSIERR